MAKIKVNITETEHIIVLSNAKDNKLPEDFSFQVCGLIDGSGEEDEEEIISVLMDRYQVQELIIKLELLLKNQIK